MPPAPPSVDDPLLGQTVGGYLVEETLGKGGMGLVYRARHPVINRNFAIKVLRPELASDVVSSGNFVREAQMLSSLKHPSIIDIVGFGSMSDGRQYMVMEFLVGRTLHRELADDGRLETERALRLSDEILDALSAAHSVDVVHRDLKPSNVFLGTVSGGREVVKLLDFGLAQQQAAALRCLVDEDGASLIEGTPAYIAPEQVNGDPATKQSDLYSFGVMLFELLTGSVPFKVNRGLDLSKRDLDLMERHVSEVAPTIHSVAPELRFPDGLAEIVADLLSKNPDHRPSSADIVRKRLAKVRRGMQADETQSRPSLSAVGAKPTVGTRRPSQPLFQAKVEIPTRATEKPAHEPKAPEEKPKRISKKMKKPKPVSSVGSAALLLMLISSFSWGSPTAVSDVTLQQPVATLPLPEVAQPADERPEPAVVAVKKSKVVRLAAPPAFVAPAPCVPDSEWKKSARASLSELATRAATSNADVTLWAADREGPMSDAIERASSETDCRAVGLELATFKQMVMGSRPTD